MKKSVENKKLMRGLLSSLLIVFSVSSFANGDKIDDSHLSQKKTLTALPQSLSNLLSSQSFTTTGETTFSILFWDLYKSKLLTTSGKYPISTEEDSLIFHINYLADISSEDLIMRTVEQWQHLGIKEEVYKNYLQPLASIWPNITSGDSLALHLKNDQSAFYFNDRYLGAIEDPHFGQLFIDIWLSNKTSQPDLRAELLGGKFNE